MRTARRRAKRRWCGRPCRVSRSHMTAESVALQPWEQHATRAQVLVPVEQEQRAVADKRAQRRIRAARGEAVRRRVQDLLRGFGVEHHDELVARDSVEPDDAAVPAPGRGHEALSRQGEGDGLKPPRQAGDPGEARWPAPRRPDGAPGRRYVRRSNGRGDLPCSRLSRIPISRPSLASGRQRSDQASDRPAISREGPARDRDEADSPARSPKRRGLPCRAR